MNQYLFKSSVCELYLVADNRSLKGVYWKKQPGIELVKSLNEQKILAQAVVELEEYFRGERKKFSLPLDSKGTAFQKRVWSQLAKIPYGKTISYKEIAEKIGHNKAMRAVGSANGKNPFCIIIPCHRVIAANGSMGGYAGGLKIKSRLLALESKLP